MICTRKAVAPSRLFLSLLIVGYDVVSAMRMLDRGGGHPVQLSRGGTVKSLQRTMVKICERPTQALKASRCCMRR